MRHGPYLVSPTSVSACAHPARDLAVSALYADLPRRRGATRRARVEVSYETVRRWVLKFGATIARDLRQRRSRPSERWHLDEMVVRISGKRMSGVPAPWLDGPHEQGLRANNRRRELSSTGATTRAQDAAVQVSWLCPELPQHPCCVHNTFNLQRHLVSRSTLRAFRAEAAALWQSAVAAA